MAVNTFLPHRALDGLPLLRCLSVAHEWERRTCYDVAARSGRKSGKLGIMEITQYRLFRLPLAALATICLIASTALPGIPPDTCDIQICGVYLPAGGHSASCDGYCIDAACLTKLEIVNGEWIYSCYCREASDSDAFTDRETNTDCRGKITFKVDGSITWGCETVLCSTNCAILIAPLPAPGNCSSVCLCNPGGN